MKNLDIITFKRVRANDSLRCFEGSCKRECRVQANRLKPWEKPTYESGLVCTSEGLQGLCFDCVAQVMAYGNHTWKARVI